MMNKEEQNILFEKLCGQYLMKSKDARNETVTFWDVDLHRDKFDEEEIEMLYKNNAACCFDEIFLGIFDDMEHRMFVFFHELGHIDDMHNRRIPKYEDLPYLHFDEASAWKTGIKLAKENGIEFSDKMFEKGEEALRGYFGDNNPEKTPIKYFNQAKKYAFSGEIRRRKLDSIL